MRTVDLIIGATSTLRARIRSKTVRGTRRQCWRWTGATARKRDGARRPKQLKRILQALGILPTPDVSIVKQRCDAWGGMPVRFRYRWTEADSRVRIQR